MKIKELLILGVALIVAVCICGCTDENTAKEYDINGAKFQMPSGWDRSDLSTENWVKFIKDQAALTIEQIKDENTFESQYQESQSDSTGNYQITTESKTVDGIEVRIVRAMDTRTNTQFDDFFFRKNARYYVIRTFDHSGSNTHKQDIEEAVNTVIKTLK